MRETLPFRPNRPPSPAPAKPDPVQGKAVETSDGWTALTSPESCRRYWYHDGNFVEVFGVFAVRLQANGHELRTTDGRYVFVPYNWRYMEIDGQEQV